jgi:hypothetical protein
MAKEHVRQSIERDAYLSRRENKQTSLQYLKTSVERLSKLMSLSAADKAELLTYAEELLERQNEGQGRDSYNGNSYRSHTQGKVPREKTPSSETDGAQASN